MQSNQVSSFEYPDFYYFPPFFTIQPVLNTRMKQLELWRDLILRYHTIHKLKIMKIYDCPLFINTKINRSLNQNDILIIVNDFCDHGHGEWQNEGDGKSYCKILWRKPEQLAVDIYDWADKNGYTGGNGICTIYELHSGEDINGMSFEGADEELLRRSLVILQSQGKCTIFKGDTSDEDGIKFS